MGNEAALIGSENETAKVAYENVIGNENPYYKTYIRSNFTSFFPRMSDIMFMYLRSYKDPRINYYFDSVKLANRYRITDTVPSTLNDSLYIVTYPMPHYGIAKSKVLLPGWTPQLTGGVDPQLASANNGGINGVSAYSMFSLNILNNPTRPLIVLSFAEAQFLKAQAKIQNLGGNQTAENYYNSGIDANFAFWGIPATLRDKYKAGNGVKFGTTGTGLWNYLHLVNADIPAGDINKIAFSSLQGEAAAQGRAPQSGAAGGADPTGRPFRCRAAQPHQRTYPQGHRADSAGSGDLLHRRPQVRHPAPCRR